MDNQDITTDATNTSAVAGEASTPSTLDAAKTAVDPIKNLKGEFQRKMSKLDEKLNAVLNAVQARGNAQGSNQSADEAVDGDTDVKQAVNAAFTEQHQRTAYQNAVEMFPELNPESDSFDEKFYKAVDVEFSSNQRRDPNGPLKAAKLVALEMGKIEQLTRTSLLKDEARRSRLLSEGSSTPRDAKKDKDPASHFNKQGLARLGINPEKLAKRMKDNKDKYEGL